MHRARLSFVACTVIASVGAAQQPDTAVLAPTVVTATRIPMSLATSPVTVTVVTGDDLRARGVTSMADALRDLPGVTVAQSGSFGALTTLFLRGGEGTYVKVLVDGVPVNDPGGAFDFGSMTTDNVERIEIVRGPASVLYGADAVTGVIQIITRRGSGEPQAFVSARAGTYASRDADGTILGALTSGDFSASVGRHDTQGIYAFNSGNHNTVGSGALHLKLDPQTDMLVTMRYTDDAFHYPTDGGGDVVDSNAVQTTAITTIGVDLGRVLMPGLETRLNVTSNETSAATDDKQATAAGSGYESLDYTRRRAADLHANVRLPQASTLTVGGVVEQEDERSESESLFGSSQSTSIFQASRRNRAAYAQVVSTVANAVTVTAGDRLDDNERFGTFNTYRAGASWAALSHTRLRASFGTAFREPSFAENYATGYVTGNPLLAPEHSTTWEAGVSQTWLADRVGFDVTRFMQRFTNMIDYTGDTTSCGASYCNVARANADGQEFELHVRPLSPLTVGANLTHLDTRVVQSGFDTSSAGLYLAGQQLIRRPRTSWNAVATYAMAFGTFDVRVNHVGERSDRDFRPYPAVPVTMPAYTRTDASAEIPVAGSRARSPLMLTFRAENLFNVDYQSVFNFKTPGRTIFAGARASF